MTDFLNFLRRPRGTGGARLMLGLGAVSIWLLMAAVVGAIVVGDDTTSVDTNGPGLDANAPLDGGESGPDATVVDPITGANIPADQIVIDPVTGKPRPATPGGATPGGTTATTAKAAPASGPGDRTGVSNTEIKIGVHAPKTFSGVPLNLAEDPIKGIEAYVKFINDRDGINGRKLKLTIEDDRFDTPGAQAAANKLINDQKNFVVSGTLGIDQVAIVAAEAAKRGVPYTAGGGAEEVPIPGMFQLQATYTTHALELAEFIAKDPTLKGKRVGILVSDSQYIKPVAETFKRRLEELGQKVSTIVTNQKPAQNPDYNGYILQFRSATTEVVVPLTDPITTQQIVQRCAAGAACGWTYSFSNFAHDSDTALALFAPTWSNLRVRGLSSVCYYLAPEVDGANCANMKVARAQYIAIKGQDDWNENGSGASSAYQLVSFIKGGLIGAGADLTRERYRAVLSDYNGYADLISSPITFRGRRSTMHGAEKMTVLEAQSNVKYKMISPGLVDSY